jgi:hypothetical protein
MGSSSTAKESVMSTVAEFQVYAAEALRWARLANNERDQHALIKLAHTWMQAAVQSEQLEQEVRACRAA